MTRRLYVSMYKHPLVLRIWFSGPKMITNLSLSGDIVFSMIKLFLSMYLLFTWHMSDSVSLTHSTYASISVGLTLIRNDEFTHPFSLMRSKQKKEKKTKSECGTQNANGSAVCGYAYKLLMILHIYNWFLISFWIPANAKYH